MRAALDGVKQHLCVLLQTRQAGEQVGAMGQQQLVDCSGGPRGQCTNVSEQHVSGANLCGDRPLQHRSLADGTQAAHMPRLAGDPDVSHASARPALLLHQQELVALLPQPVPTAALPGDAHTALSARSSPSMQRLNSGGGSHGDYTSGLRRCCRV